MAKDWTKEVRDQAQRLVDIANDILTRKKRRESARGSDHDWWVVPQAEAVVWKTRAETLLGRPFLPLTYHNAFVLRCHDPGEAHQLEGAIPALVALIQDIDDGHIHSIDARARGETLSDLLEQAEARLTDGEHVAAVMLAGGVLEAHLRHVGGRRGVTIAGNSAIGKWADGLHAAGALDRATKLTVGAWASMRNDADHLKATAFDEAAVRSMLVGVRTLLVTLPE